MTPTDLDPSKTAVFLDVDGTLLDIVDDPAAVTADPALINLLEHSHARLGSALALISGRTIAEIDRIFSPHEFAVAGTHGAETRLPGGVVETRTADGIPDSAIASLRDFAARHPELLLEIKDAAVALHYRQAPELMEQAGSAATALLDELGEDYRLISGKMVFEIAPRSHDKGAAIRRFMAHPVFTGRRPVFLGDDVTDEDGFSVVNELDGISIIVGDGIGTQARHSLPDTQAVRRWLRSAIAR